MTTEEMYNQPVTVPLSLVIEHRELTKGKTGNNVEPLEELLSQASSVEHVSKESSLSQQIRAIVKGGSETNRATGRTTRLVDLYIQLLFESEEGLQIAIVDHHPARASHENLADRIVRRLNIEHPSLLVVKSRHYSEVTIKISKA